MDPQDSDPNPEPTPEPEPVPEPVVCNAQPCQFVPCECGATLPAIEARLLAIETKLDALLAKADRQLVGNTKAFGGALVLTPR